jgi:glucose-6-phosphate dehydrogenase assembly protein OpcA
MVIQSAPLVSLQAPKDVELSQIESELKAIWQNYGTPSEDGTALAAVRASTFTLVVYEPEETQQILAVLGFYTGPIDGIGGPRTEAAIRAAQVAYDLPADGKASDALLTKLRHELAVCSGDGMVVGDVCRMPMYTMDAEGAGIADAIASQNPCRIIALLPVAGEDTGVTAQVSAYCPIQKQNRNAMICCEYITLKGTEAALERVTGLLTGLLIGGLPSFLWWKGEFAVDQELFKQLGKACTAVVIDSSRFMTEPEADLQQLYALNKSGVAVNDLNWRRLAPWQELTAAVFDPPERWSGLMAADRVTIDYERGNPSQALLFLGWLGSRLGWEPTSRRSEGGEYDIQRVYFTGMGGIEVEAELASLPMGQVGDVVGDMLDLRLLSTRPEADCNTVLCSETRGCMRMEKSGGAQSGKIHQVSSLTDQKAETLLAEQLRSWSRDVLFEESLAVTAKILQLPCTPST